MGPYRVTPFPANHALQFDALLYAVEANGRSLLYATDTAAWLAETWQAFHRLQLQFDLVVLDHTYGPGVAGGDHLNAHQVAEHVKRLRQEKLLKDEGRLFATHLSHEGNPDHATLAAFAHRHGYEIAYDGLSVTL